MRFWGIVLQHALGCIQYLQESWVPKPPSGEIPRCFRRRGKLQGGLTISRLKETRATGRCCWGWTRCQLQSLKVDLLDTRGKLSFGVIMLFSPLQSSFLTPNHWTVCVQISGRCSSLVQASLVLLLRLCNHQGLLKLIPSSTKASWCGSWCPASQLGREDFVDSALAKSEGFHRATDETAAYSASVLWRYSRGKMISTHCNIVLKKNVWWFS